MTIESNYQSPSQPRRDPLPSMNVSRREERRSIPVRRHRPTGAPGVARSPRSDRASTESMPSIHPKFSPQRLTLESAVAPLIPKPTAPFAKSERKRALTTAAYYSECCMNGIPPVEADKAALAVQSQYTKWWVDMTDGPEAKRRKENEVPQAWEQSSQENKVPPQSLEQSSQSVEPRSDNYDGLVTSEDESYLSHKLPQHGSFDMGEPINIRETAILAQVNANEISSIKNALTAELNTNGGVATTAKFQTYLNMLHSSYSSRGWDARWIEKDSSPFSMDGTWLSLTKLTYSECQGRDSKGQYIYSLGRLSFDMFRPPGLICSVQGVFNSISITDSSEINRLGSIPWRLRKDVSGKPGSLVVRNYNITVAFTVEANQTRRGERPGTGQVADGEYVVRKPIRSLLTNHGYCIPDPDVPNRLSVWFTGGCLEVQDETEDLAEWKHLFDEKEVPRRGIGEVARVLAAKVLLGASMSSEMSDDGSLSYSLKRPIGGHSQVFCDVLYADDTMRILRGHQGTTFVFSRVPTFSNDSS